MQNSVLKIPLLTKGSGSGNELRLLLPNRLQIGSSNLSGHPFLVRVRYFRLFFKLIISRVAMGSDTLQGYKRRREY